MSEATVTETKVTHTPGPWLCENVPDREGGIGVFNVTGATYRVASVQLRHESGQREANAHLIAAAPDLRDSLREFVTLYDGVRDSLGPIVREKLARAEAAIAKAEGGAR